jgi:NAD(P)-dependent dehydrogenase (short-subunit alcohol dehydrogenase family)
MSDLNGKRILVVGASSGVGKACASSFVRNGASVVFAARRRDLLDTAIAEAGGGVAVELDVMKPESIAGMVDTAAGFYGGFDSVLYTAGMSPLARLSTTTPEQWNQVFAVNTFGPSLVFAAALPHMSTDGILAAMSSDSAHQPRHSLVPYAASKAALEASMEGWRTEEIGGRRFMTILIGPTVPTGFGDSFTAEQFMAVIPHWQRQGFRTGSQSSDDVASMLSATFATLFQSPGLGMETLLLRAPEPEQTVADFGASETTFGDS